MKLLRVLLVLGWWYIQGPFSFAQQEETAMDIAEEIITKAPSAPTGAGEARNAEPPEEEPVFQIKRLDTENPLYSFELRDVNIADLFRVLAHDYKLNLLADKDVSGTVTASLSQVSLEEALETIAESQNLILKKKGNIIRISPNLVTKIFGLKYIEAKGIVETGGSSESDSSQSSSSENQPHTIYALLSEKGRVFLGKQPNSIAVIDYPPHIERIAAYLKELDQKMSRRVFTLKYLKAADVVGSSSSTNSTAGSDAASATASTTTASAAESY